MSPGFIDAVFDGDRAAAQDLLGLTLPEDWPTADDDPVLRLRLRQMGAAPTVQQWLVRAMVLREDGRPMIGHIGFHGPPDERGAVEVGYTVFPEYRRRGYAHEAVAALFDWATAQHGIRCFVASVSPTNAPSLGLVRKLGFQQVGSQWDEVDGEELVFELAL